MKPVPSPTDPSPPASVEEVIAAVTPLLGMLRVETRPADRDGWIDRESLGDPDAGPLAHLNGRFMAAGFGANRRAVAASLMLRYGWAAGLQIAAWLACGVVVRVDAFALKFSSMTLVEALWVRQAVLVRPGDEQEGRRLLAASLRDFTGGLVTDQHGWSRFSRHALWAMTVSSWAAQFAAIGQRLGRRDAAVEEARAVLALDPETADAAPDLYLVDGTDGGEVCQRRAACCLYFKGPRRDFCASCPILPATERLALNRAWANRPAHERSA